MSSKYLNKSLTILKLNSKKILIIMSNWWKYQISMIIHFWNIIENEIDFDENVESV